MYLNITNILPRQLFFTCATILKEFSCAYETPEMLYIKRPTFVHVIVTKLTIAVPAPIRILLSTEHFKRLLRRVKGKHRTKSDRFPHLHTSPY